MGRALMGTQNHPHKTQHKTGGFHNGSNRTQNSRHLCPGSRWLLPADRRKHGAFHPGFSVSRYDPSTGEVYGYAPDYDALEAAKAPAVQATAPGEYSYCYEMQQAPTGCDYAADLAYYGKHYFLRPLRDGLPPLHGRGITYDAEQGTYMVTLRAYDKIKAQYKIKRETCLD